ncbi:MAG: beta-lactamase family protein [Candidatus Eremiobacteraeota bacterium]|nr:beta-lactamase family protein [Candidatus Eremiobacteraeota bacterium]
MHKVETIVRAGLGTRYTGAVLRVERAGQVVFESAYGALDDGPQARAVEVGTPFDLASLTKVFVATTALAFVDAGTLQLDMPLRQHLPEWNAPPHARITLRMLLAHTGGLQSGADYRLLFDEDIERFALLRELVDEPGRRVIYSDLGFIVLGTLLARVAGTSLASVVGAQLALLGCRDTGYRQRNDDPDLVPATEEDAWRGRVRGAVHDEKAYLMKGVAGHAGLFGTARDVAALSEVYLAARHGRSTRALEPSLGREAVTEWGADAVLRRGLGWALKTTNENSCGSAMSRSTFGHTGFTGTCCWADPERDLGVVLLTNAVYFGRHDLRDVRAAVCDMCVAEFG